MKERGTRFLYALTVAIGWTIISSNWVADDNTRYLALAIIIAGAMAGGD